MLYSYEFKLEIRSISFRHIRKDERRNQFTRHRVFLCFFICICIRVIVHICILICILCILYVSSRRWRRMRRKLRSEQLPFLGWLVRDPLLVLFYYSMSLVAWSQIHLLSLISDWDLSLPPLLLSKPFPLIRAFLLELDLLVFSVLPIHEMTRR